MEKKLLINLKSLRGFTVESGGNESGSLKTDGADSDGAVLGTVHDLYFDDVAWQLRYFVVDTGGWLQSRRILVTPDACQSIDPADQRLITTLTKAQIETSPSYDTKKPVARQYEAQLHQHFSWQPYWSGALFPATGIYSLPAVATLESTHFLGNHDQRSNNQHSNNQAPLADSNNAADGLAPPSQAGKTAQIESQLRSLQEVIDYDIQARDGSVGHVDDYLMDRETWQLKFLVVDINNWLPEDQVVLAIGWLKNIDWKKQSALVDLPKKTIEQAPKLKGLNSQLQNSNSQNDNLSVTANLNRDKHSSSNPTKQNRDQTFSSENNV